MKPQLYDVVIIGSGIASLATALHLQAFNQQLKILLLAKPANPQAHFGETLSQQATGELSKLGLLEEFLQLSQPAIWHTFSNWGSQQLQAQTHHQPVGWQIDKARFQSFLYHHLDFQKNYLKIIHYPPKNIAFSQIGSRWKIATTQGNFYAKNLLDCSGKRRIISKLLSRVIAYDRQICLYTYADKIDHNIQATHGTLIESVENGWWYNALLPNTQLILSFFTDSSSLSTCAFKKYLDVTSYSKRRVSSGGFQLRTTPKVCCASTSRLEFFSGENWLASGDSAMSLDPLSSHGITTALWSGRKAAEALHQKIVQGNNHALARYHQTLCCAFDDYFTHKKQTYQQEQKFKHHQFWQARQ